VAVPPTIYGWAGGTAAFGRWLNTFYDLVEEDELVGPLFGERVSQESTASTRSPGGSG
jgi:hemoglobin